MFGTCFSHLLNAPKCSDLKQQLLIISRDCRGSAGYPVLLEVVAGVTHSAAHSWQFRGGGNRCTLAGPLSPAGWASCCSPGFQGSQGRRCQLMPGLEVAQHRSWCILLVKASPKARPESRGGETTSAFWEEERHDPVMAELVGGLPLETVCPAHNGRPVVDGE